MQSHYNSKTHLAFIKGKKKCGDGKQAPLLLIENVEGQEVN